jgi:protein TonB
MPAEYGPYLSRFRQAVQDAVTYPLAARRAGHSGTVQIEVLIEPTGRIREARVLSSSRHAMLDEAALEALRRVSPMPLPENLPRRPLRVRLPLVFELR